VHPQPTDKLLGDSGDTIEDCVSKAGCRDDRPSAIRSPCGHDPHYRPPSRTKEPSSHDNTQPRPAKNSTRSHTNNRSRTQGSPGNSPRASPAIARQRLCKKPGPSTLMRLRRPICEIAGYLPKRHRVRASSPSPKAWPKHAERHHQTAEPKDLSPTSSSPKPRPRHRLNTGRNADHGNTRPTTLGPITGITGPLSSPEETHSRIRWHSVR